MIIIGLTGGTGSGKSFIAEHYKKCGGFIIDADKISHEVILRGKAAYYKIVENFSKNILNEDGEIDRRKLGKIVFSNSYLLSVLTKIIHYHVIEESKNQIKNLQEQPSDYSFILIDAPLLVEADMHKICDCVIITTANMETRIRRVMERDNKSYEDVLAIINKQMAFDELKKYGNFIIETDLNSDDVYKRADEILITIKDLKGHTGL